MVFFILNKNISFSAQQGKFDEALYYFREGLKIAANNQYLQADIRDTIAQQNKTIYTLY